MSDDEVILFPTKTKVIHYGSLEDQVANIREDDPVKSTKVDVMDYEETESETKLELLEEFEKRKRARMIHVSTDDKEVKAQLRQLREPICYFGEGPADRRERLKRLLALIGTDAIKSKKNDAQPKKIKVESENVTWYHPGPNSLRNARVWIAEYSLKRTSTRIKQAIEEKKIPPPIVNAKLQELFKKNRSTSLLFSQIADTRPISYCQFSPNGGLLATASWSGLCKLWTVPDSKEVAVFRGHTLQANCVAFHPQATLTQDENSCNLASSGQDGTVFLWSMKSDTPIRSLEGHAPFKVPRLAFHPSGRFLGTCCFDRSWRLWDLEANEEILHQEGHSKEVYDISFHRDGSLALTGSMDAYGRVWDLRTGRCIMFLEGHLKSILSVDFSPNGHQMATGSEDNSVKIWDLRQRKCVYTIPAHTSLVSKIKFQPSNGLYLLSASYDKTAKIWNHPNWAPSQVLAGHEGRLMCVDISPDDKYIATASYEKNFKLWAPEI